MKKDIAFVKLVMLIVFSLLSSLAIESAWGQYAELIQGWQQKPHPRLFVSSQEQEWTIQKI